MRKGEPRFETEPLGFDLAKDYYAVLGVDPTMSEADIKTKYRKEARKCHPDLFPRDLQAENRFKEINEAFQVLGDSDKRNRYDELKGVMRTPKEQERTAVRAPIKTKTRGEEAYEEISNLDQPTPPRKEWKA